MLERSKVKVLAIDVDENGNKEVKKNGEPATYITSEDAFNASLKKATEEKKPLPELLAKGTFTLKFAETVDEAVTLAGGSGAGDFENIEVFLSVFNYGASLRQDNAANSLLTSDTYTEADEAVDVSYAVAEKVERAKMSPEEKAVKMLAAGGIRITPEQLRAALAAIKGQAVTA